MENKDSENQQIIIFKLDDKLYGVKIKEVREITRVTEINPLPNSPKYIIGVTNFRGQVATVMDLRNRLGMAPKKIDKESRMLVIEAEGRTIGMVIDSVIQISMIPKVNIEKIPEVTRKDLQEQSFVKGIAKKDSKLIVLLDLCMLAEWKDHTEIDQNVPTVRIEASVNT